jgi:hypothetical protein
VPRSCVTATAPSRFDRCAEPSANDCYLRIAAVTRASPKADRCFDHKRADYVRHPSHKPGRSGADNFAGALCFAPQMAVSVEDGRQIRSGGLIIKTDCHQRHLEDELQASL